MLIIAEFRQAVVPPMSELKRALTTFVSKAVEGNDSLHAGDKKMLEASDSERQTGLPGTSRNL